MNLGASTPDDLLGDSELAANLTKYYKLQAGDLSGTLSLTNYRGITIQGKKTRQTGVLKNPPQESQMIFNLSLDAMKTQESTSLRHMS